MAENNPTMEDGLLEQMDDSEALKEACRIMQETAERLEQAQIEYNIAVSDWKIAVLDQRIEWLKNRN